jgi:predicted nucleic acid-binding protein
MPRSFIDSGVLIVASRGNDEDSRAALEILDDPARELLSSDYVWLETVPKTIFNKFPDQTEFLRSYFEEAVVAHGASSPECTSRAKELAARYGLGCIDALLISSAIGLGADEFVTTEGPEKPMSRVKELRIVHLAQS